MIKLTNKLDPKTYFIAGTDTEIGKTTVTCKLLNYYQQQGLNTLGLKPIASGSNNDGKGEDGLLLQQASSIKLDYPIINPTCLPLAISPHLAAEAENQTLTVKQTLENLQPGLNQKADLTLIEGAGGWYAPISYQESFADLAKALNYPVILVVGMRLGCLNHGLLSAKAIIDDGLELAGWIANILDPDMPYLEENIQTLEMLIRTQTKAALICHSQYNQGIESI